MLVQQVPADVIRILSVHGPVTWWIGDELALFRGETTVAPFEDALYLFHRPGGGAEQAWQQSCVTTITARAPDGRYSVSLRGRANAGIPLTRHPRRAEIAPWGPDGVSQAALLVAAFVPEEIELTRTDTEGPGRFAGQTPAGKQRPATHTIWRRAALGGGTLALAVLVMAGVWLWLTVQGPELRGRALALVVAVPGGVLPLAGARLLAQARAFERWREGLGKAEESPVLFESLIAPAQARRAGWIALGSGVALLASVAAIWSAALAGLAVALSGVWLLGPAWAVHLSTAPAEKRDR